MNYEEIVCQTSEFRSGPGPKLTATVDLPPCVFDRQGGDSDEMDHSDARDPKEARAPALLWCIPKCGDGLGEQLDWRERT